MSRQPHNLRKAAVLVATLDDENAAALLALMSPAQASAVQREVDRLGPVDPEERRQVIEEFSRLGTLVPARQPGGIEIDDRLPRHWSQSPPAELAVPPDSAAGQGHFQFLDEVPLSTLGPFLAAEHPQTVALMLSHVKSCRAAELLAGLPAELQAEVARRLTDLDEAAPQVVAEIELELQSKLSQQVRVQQRRTAGLAALDGILSAAAPHARDQILANLARRDQQLVARLATPVAAQRTLEDLSRLDDATLGRVARATSREVLALALAGAETELADRVCRLMGRRDGVALAHALRHLGPTCLSDVEEAQRQFIDACHRGDRDGNSPARSDRSRLSIAV